MPKISAYLPDRAKTLRDDAWLRRRLDYLWSHFFADIAEDNPVQIHFGRHSKFRLGSIKYLDGSKTSQITITGMFKDPQIPTEVVDQTIAHEMCHYAHGFSSPKAQLHQYPHHGGVINAELRARGLDCLVLAYDKWVKAYTKSLS